MTCNAIAGVPLAATPFMQTVVASKKGSRSTHNTTALRDDEIELLSIMLGARKRSAATDLLRSAGGIAQLSRSTSQELAQIVGSAHAKRVVAAFELGRRALQATAKRESVGSPEEVYRQIAPRVAGLAQEVFFVIGVDIRNGLIDVVEVARGTVMGVEVHPREVFRPLIRMAAAGGVLSHNHPSGDPTPSTEDVMLTRRLRDIGQILGIPIVDHVVVAQHGFRSIAEFLGTELDGFTLLPDPRT
jgi:DNA repair protein RadC